MTCSIADCSKSVHARGWCQAHYRLARIHGVPERLPVPTIRERFEAKVHKTAGCWVWIGAKGSDRYGQMSADGALVPAHRISYELHVGPIPQGLEIDHLCLNRSCVRPDHLEPVTHTENIRRWAARITHCRNGHEYDEANTYRTSHGHRSCRACNRERSAANYAKRRGAA